jgi:hypothetical protein
MFGKLCEGVVAILFCFFVSVAELVSSRKLLNSCSINRAILKILYKILNQTSLHCTFRFMVL